MSFKCPDWLIFVWRQLAAAKRSMLLVVLITLAAALCAGAAPLLIGRIVGAITTRGLSSLLPLSLALLLSLLLADALTACRNYISAKTMITLTKQLSAETLSSVFKAPAGFMAATPRGELLQRSIQDTRTIQQFGLFTLPTLAQDSLLACIGIAVICHIYWPVAVCIICSYAVLYIPVYLLDKKRGHARSMLVAHNATIRHSLLERLESVKQIKLFGTYRQQYEKFGEEQQRWAELKFADDVLKDIYKGFPRMPDSFAPAFIFLFVGWRVAAGDNSLAELLTILAFVPAINAPVRTFFSLYAVLADIRVRMIGLLAYKRLAVEPGQLPGLLKPSSLRTDAIIFEQVNLFAAGKQILHNVTFRIRPGESAAIVGASGAGKSSLLKLIVRLLEPASGTITLGSCPLSSCDAVHLRQQLGYLPQEGFLLRDTLRNNLTLFGAVEQPDIERWMQAFDAQQIVAKLPDGYDTVLGEAAVELSGGQKQLISLVRALLKQPAMLLLDEATSALDEASEQLVQQALALHCRAITRIHVTHRLESAQLADRILVLDQGRLVEQGSHQQLIRLNGVYAALWSKRTRLPLLHNAKKEEPAYG